MIQYSIAEQTTSFNEVLNHKKYKHTDWNSVPLRLKHTDCQTVCKDYKY